MILYAISNTNKVYFNLFYDYTIVNYDIFATNKNLAKMQAFVFDYII